MAAPVNLRVERNRESRERYGLSNSTYYSRQSKGLIPKSFSLGGTATGQLAHETDAIIAAMAAGKSEDEIKALVISLMKLRQNAVRE